MALNTSTTALSNVVSLDESPLLEGLLYAGTDDGLIQVTEDGGKNWRKVEDFPGVPKHTYVTDVFASPRDAEHGVRHVQQLAARRLQALRRRRAPIAARAGRTSPATCPTATTCGPIIQDHVNGNLLFAGTEFGLFVSVDGGAHWVKMHGGMPNIQVRDITVQRRENDLVIATFGRGFYILDDYSALREITPQALADEARLFPLRDAYSFSTPAWRRPARPASATLSGNTTFDNPPTGRCSPTAWARRCPADAKLVLTITDEQGRQVRRMDVDKAPGLRRVTWNLRADPPAQAATPQGGRGGAGGGQGGFGGRGNLAALVAAGRYSATLGKKVGETVTPIGTPQVFRVGLPY